MLNMTHEQLGATTSQVFADTAFLLTEPTAQWELFLPDAVHASIGFESDGHGRLVLSLPSELARQLAADMLGVEPEDEAAEASAVNAVAEVANVLAGVLMVELFGADGEWQLGLPKIESTAPQGLGCKAALQTDMGQQIQVMLLTDGGHL
jgi:hypothetical protein